MSPTSIPSLLLTLTAVTFTAITLATNTEDVCHAIANADCRCLNNSSSVTADNPLQDVVCKLRTRTPGPVFRTGVTKLTLGTLDLSNNSLRHLPRGFFRGVGHLKRLILSHNHLVEIPAHLARLGRLEVLDLSFNRLGDAVSMAVLAAIPGLQRLDLSYNRWTRLSPGTAGTGGARFLSLKMLRMSGNMIASINGSAFASMSELVHLDLSHNDLTQVRDNTFSPLALSLVDLDLSHNALSAVQPLALRHLQHLRLLNLSRNPLQNVEQVQFPQHLQSLDLSHCTLTIINHCRLTGLADLGFIGLRGNHLTCTCQLYLLLQWYQSQHHQAGNAQASTVGSTWTCLHPPSPASSSTLTSGRSTTTAGHSNPLTADPPKGGLMRVIDLQGCEDTQSHCQTLEHSRHHLKGSSQMEVRLDVAMSGSTLMATWTLQENGEVVVDGFRLRYLPEDSPPQVSPYIPADHHSYVMALPQLEKHYLVCLDVLVYQMAVAHQECRSFTHEPSNIVVGILAGAIFIIPCIAALVYVVVKDRRIFGGGDERGDGVSEVETLAAERKEDVSLLEGERETSVVVVVDDVPDAENDNSEGDNEPGRTLSVPVHTQNETVPSVSTSADEAASRHQHSTNSSSPHSPGNQDTQTGDVERRIPASASNRAGRDSQTAEIHGRQLAEVHEETSTAQTTEDSAAPPVAWEENNSLAVREPADCEVGNTMAATDFVETHEKDAAPISANTNVPGTVSPSDQLSCRSGIDNPAFLEHSDSSVEDLHDAQEESTDF